MNPLLAEINAATFGHPLRRALTVECKVLDEAKGIVRYVASDETMDHDDEIIRVAGWQFTHFAKNSPFVDSHNYSSIAKVLGKVVDRVVEGRELLEDVQYALTEKADTLADWAFSMVKGGFIKAVSVGFVPLEYSTRFDSDKAKFSTQIAELGLSAESAGRLRAVYIRQEQLELSQCVLGANPNALAKAYKAGALTEENLDSLCSLRAQLETAPSPSPRAAGEAAHQQRAKLALLAAIQSNL